MLFGLSMITILCCFEARLSRRTHVCLGRSDFIFRHGEGYVCDGAHRLNVMNASCQLPVASCQFSVKSEGQLYLLRLFARK